MGNLRITLWDCGGQDTFMETYFETQREAIFRQAGVLIYVLTVKDDPRDSVDVTKDMSYFSRAMESLKRYSPNARVFCLIHKIDMVNTTERDNVMEEFQQQIKGMTEGPLRVSCYRTSIWDETLFEAWSQIVHDLIPDVEILDAQLKHLCTVCDAEEIVLFEKNTFLLILKACRRDYKDTHRFEKISNIVKQFKISCLRVGSEFTRFEVRNSNFYATIDKFLENSFIMVVTDPSTRPAATAANLWAARRHFMEIMKGGQIEFGIHL